MGTYEVILESANKQNLRKKTIEAENLNDARAHGQSIETHHGWHLITVKRIA